MVLILFLMSVALLGWVVRKDSDIAKDLPLRDLPLKDPQADSPVASPGVWQLARAVEEQAGPRRAVGEVQEVQVAQDAGAPRAGRIR